VSTADAKKVEWASLAFKDTLALAGHVTCPFELDRSQELDRLQTRIALAPDASPHKKGAIPMKVTLRRCPV
jgi:hypothetical protein